MKTIFVYGDYDDQGGKSSGYMAKLWNSLVKQEKNVFTIFGSGHYTYLLNEVFPQIVYFDVIYWLCHTPSDKPKLVESIKKLNPKAILIMLSKNEGDKSPYEQVARMLSVKANLMLEINPKIQGEFKASILDPLGNAFLLNSGDIDEVARVLHKRVTDLFYVKRQPSVSIGQKLQVPDESDFFNIAREHASKFHDLIHAEKQDRYLGHLSFRCEHGFPSFKKDGVIFVSGRNVDKRVISADSFVGVNPFCSYIVEYYGDKVPSVDTPLSLGLYRNFHNIKYMIHSHVYIDGCPTTSKIHPCGDINEFESIKSIVKEESVKNIGINLLGHGSLVMASDLNYFKDIQYVKRVIPELHS